MNLKINSCTAPVLAAGLLAITAYTSCKSAKTLSDNNYKYEQATIQKKPNLQNIQANYLTQNNDIVLNAKTVRKKLEGAITEYKAHPIYKNVGACYNIADNGTKECVVIVKTKDAKILTYRQNIVPRSSNEDTNYKEIEVKQYNSLDELKSDMESSDYCWGRKSWKNNHNTETDFDITDIKF